MHQRNFRISDGARTMTSLNERVWHLELVDHWLDLNRELADIYRR